MSDRAQKSETAPGRDGVSVEVTLQELGEAIASAVTQIQDELGSYDTPMGAFVVDEMEIALAVDPRVDELGQTLISVRAQGQDSPGSQIRFRIRPGGASASRYPATGAVSLAALGTLSPTAIAALAARRVFSVEDFRRLTRTAAGRISLRRYLPAENLALALRRADFLANPAIPIAVSEAVLALDPALDGAARFASLDPKVLAAQLAQRLQREILQTDVEGWQREAATVEKNQGLSMPAFTVPAVPAPPEPHRGQSRKPAPKAPEPSAAPLRV